MFKCPECKKFGCSIKPTALPGYDPKLRLFVCEKCGHRFFRDMNFRVDDKRQMKLIEGE